VGKTTIALWKELTVAPDKRTAFRVGATVALATALLAQPPVTARGVAQSLPRATPERGVDPRFDGMVDVGGYRLHARVFGDGSPAIVLVYGIGGSQDYYNAIVTGLAPHTTVITYDRGGYGQSEMATRPRDATVTTDEMRALLQALEIPGPYVMVGHSLGCLFVHLYAARFPDDVAGIVFLDHTHPDFLRDFEATLSPDEQAMFAEARDRMLSAPAPPGGIGEEMRFSLKNIETLRAAGPIPDVPLVVMASPFEGRITPLHRRLSEESLSRFVPMARDYAQRLARLSSRGKLVVIPGVTHHFPLEQPDQVVDAVLEVLQEARGR
jgi:pimeloyl-ACP methyl ester carboxylesterase